MKIVNTSQSQHFQTRFGFGCMTDTDKDFLGQDLIATLNQYFFHESLEDLDARGNLIYTDDFRDIYSIIASKLWKNLCHF